MIDSKNGKIENTARKNYGKACTLSKEDFIKEYKINPNGLSTAEAEEHIDKYGLNEITSKKPKKWYNYF